MIVPKLDDHSDGFEAIFVLTSMMTEAGLQAIEKLELAIDVLMASPNCVFHSLERTTLCHFWVLQLKLPLGARVTLHTLVLAEKSHKSFPEDCRITFGCQEWPTDMHNVIGLNANSQFIFYTRPIQLLAIVCPVEWPGLMDGAIRAIEGNEADIPLIPASETIAPYNLEEQKW
jgi:hypothetical protein